MRSRILDYMQLTLQGIGIASLGTLNIFEPRFDTLLYGCISTLLGIGIAFIKGEK